MAEELMSCTTASSAMGASRWAPTSGGAGVGRAPGARSLRARRAVSHRSRGGAAPAWQLKQSPDIAANLAQTEADLGKHRDAAEHFAFALAHVLPSSTDEQKKALEEGLEAEKKEVGTLHVTVEPSDAVFSVDEAPVTLPTNGDVFVDPGDHRTSVSREGYQSNQQTVHVSKGAARVLWINLVEVGAPAERVAPATSEPIRESTNRPTGGDGETSSGRSLVPVIVGGGLVVAGVATGIGFLLSGNSHDQTGVDLGKKIPSTNGCGQGSPHSTECGELNNEAQKGANARRLETISLAVAGAAAIGTILYFLWPHDERRERRD